MCLSRGKTTAKANPNTLTFLNTEGAGHLPLSQKSRLHTQKRDLSHWPGSQVPTGDLSPEGGLLPEELGQVLPRDHILLRP